MAKTFYTNGTGSQQTLTGSQDEKVAVYQTVADAEADLANLEAGQIVATPDTGDEYAQPVDEVTDGDMHAVTSNAVFDTYAVISASSTVITGKPISQRSVIKIMFTSAISGSDTTTAMSISYNGTSYPVKVGKNGSLANFTASEISSGTYRYLQAYTTLELAFDGTQFIIIGNPVVLSSADYTIYADGYHTVNSVTNGNMSAVTSNAVASSVLSLLRGESSQKFKVLVSGYFNNSNWSAGVMHEGGYHSYLVIAQRLGNGDTYFAIVNTLGEENNKEYVIKEIVNVGFTIEHNQFGTFIVEYSDPSNIWNYTIFVAQLA